MGVRGVSVVQDGLDSSSETLLWAQPLACTLWLAIGHTVLLLVYYYSTVM